MGLGSKPLVGTNPTILAPGEPLFDNISFNNHGELNSRETCRLLRPTSQNLSSISLNTPMTRTRTLPTMMSEQLGVKFAPRDGGKMASSLAQNSGTINSSCFAASDELNTPEIGLNYYNGFKFGPNFDTENQPLVPMPDVEMSVSEWGDMPPIAINTPEEQPLCDMLGWSSSRSSELKLKLQLNPPQRRPAELKLTLQATPIIPNVNTPNVVMDTPDVFKQLNCGVNPGFDLINFVLDDKAAATLDSPQISSTSKIDVSNTYIKREDPLHGSANFVTSTSQDVEDQYQPQIEFVSVPVEAVTPSTSTSSRKRTYSRRASAAEFVNYNFSDSEDSNSTSVSSKRPRTQSRIKEERDEEDQSSIAGSATEFKYHEHRVRNNEASRRSRHNRKQRESEMESKAEQLESNNRRLRSKVDQLEHLVITMRKALLDSISKASKNK